MATFRGLVHTCCGIRHVDVTFASPVRNVSASMRTEPFRRAAGRRRVRLALTLAATPIGLSTALTIATSGSAAAEPRPIHEDSTHQAAPSLVFEDVVDDAFLDDDGRAPSRSTSVLDVCPVDGRHDFEDSWGWPRSGGRTHQGVDLIAERGTPIVAVRDGVVEHTQSRLGGRSAWLITDDGTRFYYAHLDEWTGPEREVEVGDVIGTVGSTGNAGGPHLHFEIRPDDDAINPYTHTVQACGDPTVEAAPAVSTRHGHLVRPV